MSLQFYLRRGLPPGYQQRVIYCVRMDKRALRQPRMRSVDAASYIPRGFPVDMGTQRLGPVPLPFKHRRRHW